MDSTYIVKPITSQLVKSGLEKFSEMFDSFKHLIDDGYFKYYLNSLLKYNETKTLLHRQPTDFYKIYYPTKLDYDGEYYPFERVSDLFKKGGCITIIGDAGSGKSTFIRHLFMQSFYEAYKLPIFVTLRDFNADNCDLIKYVQGEIYERALASDQKHVEKLLKAGNFIFFLDGYDEVKSLDKEQVTQSIEKFVDCYPKNNFVLTSRPYSDIEYFKSFHNFKIKNLDTLEQIEFVKQQVFEPKLADKISESLTDNNQEYINSFFQNPLLLTLYIIAYSKNSTIPTSKYIFYRRVFDVLFVEHDSATKVGFEREIRTQLSQESIEKILSRFSFLSFFDDEYDFDKNYIMKLLRDIKERDSGLKFDSKLFIDDMKISIGLWTEDAGVYEFAHRSLQEYFAALFISQINDQDNKKKVYSKLREALSRRKKQDYVNFFSLCFEMDRKAYIESILIPILQKLSVIFGNSKKPNCSLSFLGSTLQFSEEDGLVHFRGSTWTGDGDCDYVMEASRVPGLSLDFYLIRASSYLADYIQDDAFMHYFNVHERKEIDGNVKYSNFEVSKKEGIEEDEKYIDYLKSIGLYEYVFSVAEKIESQLKDYLDELEKQAKEEESFISMI